MRNFLPLFLFIILLFFSCNSEDGFIDNGYANTDASLNNGYSNSSFSITGDNYAEHEENPFIKTSEQNISTFSVDADGASYANVRRFIQQDNSIPPKGAVRTEELINYFDLDYQNSGSSHPINMNGEVSSCPWNHEHKLIRIGIKGRRIHESQIPPSNYVFLIDVSGSMGSDDKLELLKQGFISFIDELDAQDRIAIVTYAGSSGVHLESTAGDQKSIIRSAISNLGSGGSTAGAEGIITAYNIAENNFIPSGNNRVIMGTDGDFNVGITDADELIKLIEEKRESGIYLSVLGVGRGNLNDASLEQIANNGNGTYEYIDKVEQLNKIFIHENSKFHTVAKDVKVQVEFNELMVEKYRLIGYENRILNEEDFEDDEKDAGEIGADQSITALYEILPKQDIANLNHPTFTIDFRYKMPDEEHSIPLDLEIFDKQTEFSNASDFMKFTASIAAYSMLLTDSEYKGSSTYDKILSWLNDTQLKDAHGYKAEFKKLVEKTREL